MSTDKTLATAKPGGCVQLPTSERARFEAWAESAGYALTLEDGRYEFAATRCAWTAWRAATESRQMGSLEPAAWVPPNFFNKGVVAATARRNPPSETAVELRGEYVPLYLAAQPSPGGQDAPFPWENFPAYLIDKCEGDTISEEGLQQALAAMAKDERYCLAARQPVGEPVCFIHPRDAERLRTKEFSLRQVDTYWSRISDSIPVYLGQPAQAVDLGPVRDVFRRWHANELNSTDAMLALVEALAFIDSQAVGK